MDFLNFQHKKNGSAASARRVAQCCFIHVQRKDGSSNGASAELLYGGFHHGLCSKKFGLETSLEWKQVKLAYKHEFLIS